MEIISYQDPSSFGYKTHLKDYAKTCAYTGEKFTTKEKATAEHVKPHSDHGASNVSNYLPVKADINEERGNMPFKDWFYLHPEIEENINKVIKDLDGKEIDGIIWSKTIKKTLNKELGEERFKGRRLNIYG